MSEREIKTYMESAGKGFAVRSEAAEALRDAWAKIATYGDDPALISEYIQKVQRDLGYEAEGAQ